jgi:hypothetical protein
MQQLNRKGYEWTCTLCGAKGIQSTLEGGGGWSHHYYRFHYTPAKA